jgi:hypothetical protein
MRKENTLRTFSKIAGGSQTFGKKKKQWPMTRLEFSCTIQKKMPNFPVEIYNF